MGKDEKHSVRSNVIGTVIGGLILSGIGYAVLFVPNLFRRIADLFVQVWGYFTASTSTPRWLLWLLFLTAAVTVFRLIRPALKRRSDEPRVSMYREDTFEGVIWRWSYDWANNPVNIQPYCPHCDTMLVHSESSFWSDTRKVSFYCENCKRMLTEIEGGGRSYAISMIARLIDRKIRSEEWRRLVNRAAR
jgi:hypothetical protein